MSRAIEETTERCVEEWFALPLGKDKRQGIDGDTSERDGENSLGSEIGAQHSRAVDQEG